MIRISRGFTLIEVMVVITILAIVSGITLTFVTRSRSAAKDSRILSNLQQIRTSLEIGFNGLYYEDLIDDGSGLGTLSDTGPSYQKLSALAADISSLSGESVTYNVQSPSGVTDFAIYARLTSDPTLYICYDSANGFNNKTTISTGVTCP